MGASAPVALTLASRRKTLNVQSDALLGGSWVVISGVISRVPLKGSLITHIRGLVTPFITTHEPPSKPETSEAQRLQIEKGPRKNSAPSTLKPGFRV